MSKKPHLMLAAAIALAMASPAAAHPGHDIIGSFASGALHPLSGLDHMLTMVAVGIWAAMLGGRAIWIVPLAFVGTMVLGFILGATGVPLVGVEPMIMASIVVLGLLVAMAVRLPVGVGAAIVGLFALFHGHAHGGELAGAVAIKFALGFILSTALLHAAGIALGLGIARVPMLRDSGVRVLGAATAMAGVALALN